MKKTIALALTLSMICPYLAQGQSQVEGKKLELKDQSVTSVIYSRVAGKALVGLLDANSIIHFIECEVPAVAAGQDVKLDSFQSCETLEKTSFFADESSVERVNARFPQAVTSAYEALQLQNAESERKEVMGTRDKYVPVAMLFGMVGGVAIYTGYVGTFSKARNLNYLGRVGFAGLGAVGIAITGSSLYALAWAEGWLDRYSVVPLEASVAKTLQALNEKDLVPADASFEDLRIKDLYAAMKTGLIESIKPENGGLL